MTASNRDTSSTIAPALRGWYADHARVLPWRSHPESEAIPDPYHVWLSEVMLQQTTTAAVAPFFRKFTERWPDVKTLAAAPEEEVMAAWAGLGYYSRARNLVACARIVAERGRFPEDEAGLRELPGLGAYTAAAIAAIAYGQRAVVVDANVERVVARLFNIAEPLPGARKAIRAATDAITPAESSGDFAQAMMDLGATICISRAPRCSLCPLSDNCMARQAGDPARLPVKPPKKAKPVRQGRAFWIESAGSVWLIKRASKGMLGGMRALPDDGWSAQGDGAGGFPMTGDWQAEGSVRHVFTHAALDLDVWRLDDRAFSPPEEGQWWPIERLDEAGLPTLFAKAARLVLATSQSAD